LAFLANSEIWRHCSLSRSMSRSSSSSVAAFGRGADDEGPASAGRKPVEHVAEPLALVVGKAASRCRTSVACPGTITTKRAREAHFLRKAARPLCAIGFLVTCTMIDCPLRSTLSMRGRCPPFDIARVVDHVAAVEHAVLGRTDVDERGLHAGQDVLDPPEIDVAVDRQRVVGGHGGRSAPRACGPSSTAMCAMPSFRWWTTMRVATGRAPRCGGQPRRRARVSLVERVEQRGAVDVDVAQLRAGIDVPGAQLFVSRWVRGRAEAFPPAARRQPVLLRPRATTTAPALLRGASRRFRRPDLRGRRGRGGGGCRRPEALGGGLRPRRARGCGRTRRTLLQTRVFGVHRPPMSSAVSPRSASAAVQSSLPLIDSSSSSAFGPALTAGTTPRYRASCGRAHPVEPRRRRLRARRRPRSPRPMRANRRRPRTRRWCLRSAPRVVAVWSRLGRGAESRFAPAGDRRGPARS